MEKNDMTPIGCNNCLVYEEFNKEDLKEAGVVLEYKDDVIKQKGINDKNKTKKRKDWLRCLMFLFLVLSFLLLVFIGEAGGGAQNLKKHPLPLLQHSFRTKLMVLPHSPMRLRVTNM